MKKALTVLALCLTVLSCKQQEQKPVVSPPGYNFSQPVKRVLSEDLNEISGLYFLHQDSSIITLNDEEGKFYRLDLKGKLLGKAFKFAKKSDFEDLTTDGRYWYAIKSDGEVYRVSGAFTDQVETRTFPFTEAGWEFESIFFDAARQQLVTLSKIPKSYSQGRIPAFVLDTASGAFRFDSSYSPDTTSILSLTGKKKWECKPTAAAIHPLTGELYILSVHDRLLLTMKDGKVNGVYPLHKTTFRQPEGIAFMPNGDLLISNEAQESTANILLFAYRLN